MSRPGLKRSEQGSAILVVAIWLILLAFLGLAVDLGRIFFTRRAMQNACDAGALAGALNLQTSPGTAAATAVSFTSTNLSQTGITPFLINNTPTAKTLTWSDGSPAVQVDVQANSPLTFLRYVFPGPVTIAIECAAKITPVKATGIVPVGVSTRPGGYAGTGCTLANFPSCLFTRVTGLAVHTGSDDFACDKSGGTCRIQLLGPSNCPSGIPFNWACIFQESSRGNYSIAPSGTTPTSCTTTDCVSVETGMKISGLNDAIFGTPNGANDVSPGRCTYAADTLTSSTWPSSNWPGGIIPSDLQPNYAPQWVVTVPFADLSQQKGQSPPPSPIQGFGAYLLDCPTIIAQHCPGGVLSSACSFTPNKQGDVSLPGWFVSITTTEAAGGGTVETGVNTVILVQ